MHLVRMTRILILYFINLYIANALINHHRIKTLNIQKFNTKYHLKSESESEQSKNSKSEAIDIDDTSTAYADIEIVKGQVNLLVDLWEEVIKPSDIEGKIYLLQEYNNMKHNHARGLIDHFQNCKDCAADGAFIMPNRIDNKDVIEFTNLDYKILSGDTDDLDNWGDDVLADMKAMGIEPSDENGSGGMQSDENGTNRPVFPIENNDDIILADTKAWVQRVIA